GTPEGGNATPCIGRWPNAIDNAQNGTLRHAPGYLPDIMATFVDVAGATYPSSFDGHAIAPLEGQSLLPVFGQDTTGDDRKPMYWEHEVNAAGRIGKCELVKPYPRAGELYHMDTHRTERHDLAAREPERVKAMAAQYDAWAKRCGVLDREKVVALMQGQGVARAFWEKDVD